MINSGSNSLKTFGYIFFGAAMVSFTSVFVELSHNGPTAAAFYRMFFGGIILLGISIARGERLWLGLKSLGIPLLGALFFSLDLFFWHRSINFVGPGLGTILGNMQVFFVALFAVWFLKEKLGWRLIVSIPLAVLGLFLIVRTGWGQQGGVVKLGVFYGLLTAISYALYILVIRESQTEDDKKQYLLFPNMAWICMLSALMLGITVLIEPGESFVIPDLQTWGALLGLGIFGQVIGWVSISKGLPQVSASIGGLSLLIQPALAFMWDILFFDRPTTGMEYLGVAVVMSAIYLGASD